MGRRKEKGIKAKARRKQSTRQGWRDYKEQTAHAQWRCIPGTTRHSRGVMIPGNGGQLTRKLAKRAENWKGVEAPGPGSWAWRGGRGGEGTQVLCAAGQT
jgi:hypothetical protein